MELKESMKLVQHQKNHRTFRNKEFFFWFRKSSPVETKIEAKQRERVKGKNNKYIIMIKFIKFSKFAIFVHNEYINTHFKLQV